MTFSELSNQGGQILVDAGNQMIVTGRFSQLGGGTEVNGRLTLSHAVQLAGGTLTGTGTVAGTVVNVNAQVSPGNSPGTLTIHAVKFHSDTGRPLNARAKRAGVRARDFVSIGRWPGPHHRLLPAASPSDGIALARRQLRHDLIGEPAHGPLDLGPRQHRAPIEPGDVQREPDEGCLSAVVII